MISGQTIERTTSTYIDKKEKITPRGDRIILKPLKWEPSKIIECVRFGRPVRGEILAIGPGAYRKKYNKDRSKVWETEVFVPTSLKVGDIVELGGLNIFDGQGYSFQDVMWGDEKCLIIQEQDVAFVVEQ